MSTPTPAETERLQAALASEADIARQAAEVRGDATALTPELFLRLLSLLREPIPAAYIQSLGAVKGKPYDSTGIRSVQVQIDRMDAVLTPLWWRDTVEYEQDGKLARVTVEVGPPDAPMFARSSHGGVNQASTTGNLYKGSYTNAAKVAFARVGPGHEVYVGMTDLDPDVHGPSAEQQAREPRRGEDQTAVTGLPDVVVAQVREAVQRAELPTDDLRMQLVALGVESVPEGPIMQSTVRALTERQADALIAHCAKVAEGRATEEQA